MAHDRDSDTGDIDSLFATDNSRGILVTEPVDLGAAFAPRLAPLALVKTLVGIEIWVPSGVQYCGTHAAVRSRAVQPQVAGCWLLVPACPTATLAVTALSVIVRAGADLVRPLESLTDLTAVSERTVAAEATTLSAEQITESLDQRVRGQHHATTSVGELVHVHLARDRRRSPLVIAAPGPTGTGKSSCAAHLAKTLEPLGFSLVNVDCNTLTESHSVHHLTGSPPGYSGHGSGTTLADVLGANPRRVVLLDEIEKAHPAILTVLMAAFDSGRLPVQGKPAASVDCSASIFMLTSNLGATELVTAANESDCWDDPIALDALGRSILRAKGLLPEIVGRLTRIVPFRPIAGAAAAEVVVLAVKEVVIDFGLELDWVAPSIVSFILEALDAESGSRSPQRIAERLLATSLIAAAAAHGKSAITIDGPPVVVCSTPQLFLQPRRLP